MRSAWRASSVSCRGFKPENNGTRNKGAITLSMAMASNLADADLSAALSDSLYRVQSAVDKDDA
jgi:hypothetical protein